jgi:Phytanoyl-CoA dioxygenase (PhyH)
VDQHFDHLCSGVGLPSQYIRQLIESGFVLIPGPVPGDRLAALATAYDEMMAAASGPDFKIANTTTRMSDLLNRGPSFDDIFLYPPLLNACSQIIGEPFKLSSFLARTLRPMTPHQELHADLSRDSPDAPLVGFILMVDAFREDNGATRFVPTSHCWTDLPTDRLPNTREECSGEVLACGEAGYMIIFNGAVWHGHTANITSVGRRSIQGYFVRRDARSVTDFSKSLLPTTLARLGPSAQYLLGLTPTPPR